MTDAVRVLDDDVSSVTSYITRSRDASPRPRYRRRRHAIKEPLRIDGKVPDIVHSLEYIGWHNNTIACKSRSPVQRDPNANLVQSVRALIRSSTSPICGPSEMMTSLSTGMMTLEMSSVPSSKFSPRSTLDATVSDLSLPQESEMTRTIAPSQQHSAPTTTTMTMSPMLTTLTSTLQASTSQSLT